MKVSFAKLVSDHFTAVRSITLSEQDVAFATSAEQFLADDADGIFRYVILFDDLVVGFFKIQETYSQSHDFCPPEGLGLRMVAIDNTKQGQGIGTAMVRVLPSLLRTQHGDFSVAYLTVNCQNPAARRCYEKGGFEDTGALYLGGELGPQHIMRMVF